MSETVDTTKVGNSASLAPTAPSTVPAENTNPATDSPASPPATVAAPGAGQRGRTASAHHRDRVGTSTAAASRAAGRPRVAGTVTPAEAAAAAKAPGGGDVAGDRDAGPVPEQVWAVLLTRPGSTAAELAATADVGRSTVSKLLATWASEGTATSTPGATARAARRWTATPDTTTDTTTAAAPRQAEGVGAVDANAARSATETASQACGQASQLAGTDAVDDAPSSLQPPDSATRGTRRGPVADAAVHGTSPGSPAGVANAGAATGPAEARPRVPRSQHRGSSRLAAGQLRGMVEEYLAEHPGPHGPVAIGHALGHSSGAIANSCGSSAADEVSDPSSGAAREDAPEPDPAGLPASDASSGGREGVAVADRVTGGLGESVASVGGRSSRRLAAGALRGMVEDFLAERPGEEFGPTAIGHALRHSSGAIANALERLRADGVVALTGERPRRYSIVTAPE
jgi:hypothetical protein